MRFVLFVAARYLLSARKQTFISLISVISMLGVALGVGALIVAMGIMNGFTQELRDKILGVNAHGIITSLHGAVFNPNALVAESETVPGVEAATPFIYSEVMISTPAGAKGLVLRGIDPTSAKKVLGVLANADDEALLALNSQEGSTPGIIVGEELAKKLNLRSGSRVNMLSSSGEKTASGFQPAIRPFKVVGTFRTGMFEFDSSLGFIGLDAARDLLGLPANMVSGLELTVEDVYAADKVMNEVISHLHEYNPQATQSLYARSWMEMNVNLFAALKLEKIAMFVVLALIVLVASFSIVTTLIMLVMEKTKDIAILMSMGATRRHIRQIFMAQGMIIGGVGTVLGFIIGLTLSFLLKHYQFIDLPEQVYPMDTVPMLLYTPDLIIIAAGAMLICFLATIYPAWKASGLELAEALRYE
ncbi:MAG: ABC transporter permease [Desulfovibrionaceae bacterium]|nr:ABC transporter permease [Desulfovibrionaceae bacterium]